MRHVILTCRNHPNLRWSTKEEACNGGGKPGDPAHYNSSRNIYFLGEPTGAGMYDDNSGLQCATQREIHEQGRAVTMRFVKECSCSSRDLIIAPEDPLVKRATDLQKALDAHARREKGL